MITLTLEQQVHIDAWKATLPAAVIGASGGRFTYLLTPTGVGTIMEIQDNITGHTLNITDYTTW